MNNPLVIVVDADAIVAQTSVEDNLHIQAVNIVDRLTVLNAQVLFPATAIAEATTHIQRVLNNGALAHATAVAFTDPGINILEINHETIRRASQFFSPKTSKKNTLFDCIIGALAEEYRADAIFSFDKFYKKKGFKLVADII